jgi:hypothetical protein
MDPFPEQWELISLFESEPTLLDPEVPWFYNRVAFVLQRDDERIECDIEPADHMLDFRWSIQDRTVVRLQLANVVGLVVRQTPESEGLTITTSGAELGSLYIQVSPEVGVIWTADIAPSE